MADPGVPLVRICGMVVLLNWDSLSGWEVLVSLYQDEHHPDQRRPWYLPF